MDEFVSRINRHIEHVKNVGFHCTTEETTKQALILPLLDILGFSPYDPTKVRAEYAADFPGVKANERVDYALFCQGLPVMFIEAKAFNEKLTNHAPQLSRYFNSTPDITVAAITNGKEWRFFTDLKNKNVMDSDPFLTINLESKDVSDFGQLYRFRHDQFQAEALRILAEESVYLAAFKQAISKSLKEVDADFVRYVATRAEIKRQFNAKFIESITPIVRQAVERAVSEMVITGLSVVTSKADIPNDEPMAVAALSLDAPITDPTNPRIITTIVERKLFEVVTEIVGESDVQAKDTESYFNILYQGKNNRWLLRYFGDKAKPSVQFPFLITEKQETEITRAGLKLSSNGQILLERPEHLSRIPGLLFDAIAYCKNDENFKRKESSN